MSSVCIVALRIVVYDDILLRFARLKANLDFLVAFL